MTKQHEAYGFEGEEEKAEAAATAEEKAAVKEEERLKKLEEEAAAKEPVRAKIVRLIGELRSGRLFGADRKRAWGELEATAGGLKTE